MSHNTIGLHNCSLSNLNCLKLLSFKKPSTNIRYNNWDSFRPTDTNASRLNCYNFPTVNAIDFLFSTLHTCRSTPFHYGETYFGALHQFLADATRSETPCGSKPPHSTHRHTCTYTCMKYTLAYRHTHSHTQTHMHTQAHTKYKDTHTRQSHKTQTHTCTDTHRNIHT